MLRLIQIRPARCQIEFVFAFDEGIFIGSEFVRGVRYVETRRRDRFEKSCSLQLVETRKMVHWDFGKETIKA